VLTKKYTPIPAGITLLLLFVLLGVAGVWFYGTDVHVDWWRQELTWAVSGLALVVSLVGGITLIRSDLVGRNLIGYTFFIWRDEKRTRSDGTLIVRDSHPRHERRWSKKLRELRETAFACVSLELPLGGLFRGRAVLLYRGVDIGHELIHRFAYDPADERRVRITAGWEHFRMEFNEYCAALECINFLEAPRELPPGEIIDRQQRHIAYLASELRYRRDVAKERDALLAERDQLALEAANLREQLRLNNHQSSVPDPAQQHMPPPEVCAREDADRLAPTPIANAARAAGEKVIKGATMVGAGLRDTAGEIIAGGRGLVEKARSLDVEDLTDAAGKVADGKKGV
jgi:hypothetical protein